MATANSSKIEKAQEMYYRGVTCQKISEELGISIATARRYVRAGSDYINPLSNCHWSLETQEEMGWKWPVTVNLIRRACGKEPLPVPVHDRDAEREWLVSGRKTKNRRRRI